MLLDFWHQKMLGFACKECGDHQMQIWSSWEEKNCNDIIDENNHKHWVEGAVCDTEFFTHCSVLLTSLLGLLFSQGRWSLYSQIYYAFSFKCAMQLWIPSFLIDCIFLVVFIAQHHYTILAFLYTEKAVLRERWVHNSSYITLNTWCCGE